MSSPWNKLFDVSALNLAGKKIANAVRETNDFNNTICEGNSLLSIATLGLALILRMKATGMNNETIAKQLDTLRDAVLAGRIR